MQEDQPVDRELSWPAAPLAGFRREYDRVKLHAADHVLPRPVDAQSFDREFTVDGVPHPVFLHAFALQQAERVAAPSSDMLKAVDEGVGRQDEAPVPSSRRACPVARPEPPCGHAGEATPSDAALAVPSRR